MTCAAADAGMDLDLELGTEKLHFDPTEYCLWYIASPGQQLEKKLLYPQQVADRFCLTRRDLEILQRESATKFYFRQINNSLLLALNPLACVYHSFAFCFAFLCLLSVVTTNMQCGPCSIIWNNSLCYVFYYGDLSSIRFRDFVSAAESWVSSGLPFDNSLVIQAALRLIYECVQDQVNKLKSGVEDCWFFSRTLHDLRKDESILSSIISKKFMVEIFDSGSPGGVAVFLETKQLQECLKPWNSIPEQLDSIRAMLNKKLRKFNNMMVLIVVFGLLMVAAIIRIPLYRVFVYVLVAVFVMRCFISMELWYIT